MSPGQAHAAISFQQTHITLISVFAVAHLLLSHPDQSVFVFAVEAPLRLIRTCTAHTCTVPAFRRHGGALPRPQDADGASAANGRALPPTARGPGLSRLPVCHTYIHARTHAHTHTHTALQDIFTPEGVTDALWRSSLIQKADEAAAAAGMDAPNSPGAWGGVGAKGRSLRLPTIKVLAGCGPTSLGRSQTGTSK